MSPPQDDSAEELWRQLENILHRLRRAIAHREAQWRQAQAAARRRALRREDDA